MSTNIQDLISNNLDIYLGDTSTISISTANRYAALSEAVKQLYNEFEFDFTNRTYEFDYFDGVNYYNMSSSVAAPDFAVPVDLRKEKEDHTEFFTRKTPREIAIEINEGTEDNCFAIERRNQRTYLVVNETPENSAVTVHDCDSTGGTQGTWAVESTDSDATNLTIDENEYKEGDASVNFDVDVSQSTNHYARIYNSDFTAVDLSDEDNQGSLIFWIYFPDATYISNIGAHWGSSTTDYWAGTVGWDINKDSFSDGWNRIAIEWENATKQGSPDVENIDYVAVDIVYTSSQADDTDFRVDNIQMIKPDKFILHYQSYYIGIDHTVDMISDPSTACLTEFWDGTNIPFYSGTYDHFDPYVGHLAAAILFRNMGMRQEAIDEEAIATREITRLKKKFPSHELKETKNFKVHGLSWD